jgi:2-keto-4-pentenoate hydratase/2-oxohepta-3-ene-1,7-dioic acid hydratase in catechol pathway
VTSWVRYRSEGKVGFGTLVQSEIVVHDGDMFAATKPSGQRLALKDVELLAPSIPSKIIGLWNNFHAFGIELNSPKPMEPLYFLKAPSSVSSPGAVISRPASYDGRTYFEGELGIVIGKTCSGISVDQAEAFIFGYTCVNDITAVDIFNRDASFEQWTRAKSYDGYGPFGPAIVSGIDPLKLTVRAILNGAERQNYPVSDMIFGPHQLVSKISHDMTLLPGDLICCGTSVGVDAMKEPINKVTIAIDGIGELNNEFHQ